MEQILIDTVIDKVTTNETRLENQEKELLETSKKVSMLTDQTDIIKELTELVRKLQNNMISLKWPVKEITDMSDRLSQNNELLANPKKTKLVVFHTAGRLSWIVIGLFIGIILLTMVLFNTFSKLDQYRTNDLMWRYIKVTNNNQNLEYIQTVEKLYASDPEKMLSLVEKEELLLKQVEESAQKNLKDGSGNPDKVIDTTFHSLRKKKHNIKANVK